MITKENSSYVIEFDSQTEMIYGIDAIKYLDKKDKFDYDTQIIFPKKTEGVLSLNGKDVELTENSAALITEGTDAKVKVKKGYPLVVISKKDFDWYERYGQEAKDINIKNKFLELIYYNSHLYNGDFTPNVFLPSKLRDDKFLKTLSIDKWEARNNLINEINDKKDLLNETDKKSVEIAKTLFDKLIDNELVEQQDDGYLRFKAMYVEPYRSNYLKEHGLSEDEIKLLTPIYNQAYQVHKDSRFSIKNSAKDYPPELIEKNKKMGILLNNKKDADEFIYWKKCYHNEQSLRNSLTELGYTPDEINKMVECWLKSNKTGYDISGLKFINDNVAVYNLNDKLNNWTQEGTNWVTNSTALSSTKGQTPFIGVSMVQTDKKRAMPMKEIRSEEILHAHPNLEEKRQTEIYIVTSGAAALNVIKDGKSKIELLRQGEMAVVGPGVEHCVNSVLGEYEHIAIQVPSAFQYGFNFKVPVTPPEDYDESILQKEALEALNEYNLSLCKE
jgi:mannose-6-phosphate isomerase-like protein (cupin superfamily)